MYQLNCNEIEEVSGGDAAATRPLGTNPWGEDRGLSAQEFSQDVCNRGGISIFTLIHCIIADQGSSGGSNRRPSNRRAFLPEEGGSDGSEYADRWDGNSYVDELVDTSYA